MKQFKKKIFIGGTIVILILSIIALSGCSTVTIYFEDFEDGIANDWVPDHNDWYVEYFQNEGYVYVYNPKVSHPLLSCSIFDDMTFDSFIYEVDAHHANPAAGGDWFGIIYRSDGSLQNCIVAIFNSLTEQMHIYENKNGVDETIYYADIGNHGYPDYTFKVICIGKLNYVYLNNDLIFQFNSERTSGKIGVGSTGYHTNFEVHFDNVSVSKGKIN